MKTKIIGILLLVFIPGILSQYAATQRLAFTQEDTLQTSTDTLEIADTLHPTHLIKDIPAQFPGGDDALNKYIRTHLSYPLIAQQQGIEGRIVASIEVDEEGQITHIEVLNDIGGGCATEVYRMLSTMPVWIPQRKAGKNVASQTHFTFTFKL